MAKKKIVFIMNNFWIGGVERLLFGLAMTFRVKHDIEIITVLGSGPLEPEFRNIPVRVCHASQVFFANKKLPLKLFWIAAAPVTFIRLVIFLIKVKPDIVVTSLYQADVLGIAAAFLCGIKKRILIQHDIQKFGFFRKHFKSLLALNPATHIVAVSNAVQKFLASYWYVPQSKINVIHNGIDLDKFKSAIRPLHGEAVLGILGRLEDVKGHMFLLKALKILKDIYKIEPKVIVAGGGTLRKDLEEYTKANLLKKIEFMGPIADASEFFKLIDILVVPSLEEGFGLVVLEGLASRKTIVASDISAFKELIRSGKNGVLFKTGNAEDLAHKLKEITEQPDLIRSYKANVDLWMNQAGYKYDIRHVANEYEKIIS